MHSSSEGVEKVRRDRLFASLRQIRGASNSRSRVASYLVVFTTKSLIAKCPPCSNSFRLFSSTATTESHTFKDGQLEALYRSVHEPRRMAFHRLPSRSLGELAHPLQSVNGSSTKSRSLGASLTFYCKVFCFARLVIAEKRFERANLLSAVRELLLLVPGRQGVSALGSFWVASHDDSKISSSFVRSKPIYSPEC